MLRSVWSALAVGALFLAASPGRAEEPKPAPGKDVLPRVSLGMTVQEVPLAEPFGGLLVREVKKGGPADKAGLKKGDIIVRVNSRQVNDFDELVASLAGYAPGQKLNFLVLRDDETKEIPVTLGKPAASAGTASKPSGPKGKDQSCPFLGVLAVSTRLLTTDMVDWLGLQDDNGVVVLDVVPGSPAAKAALRHGDVITRVNGKRVDRPSELCAQLRAASPGDTVKLEVHRGETSQEKKVTLGRTPNDVRLMRRPRGSSEASEAGPESSAALRRLERRLDRLERRLNRLEKGRGEKPAGKAPSKRP